MFQLIATLGTFKAPEERTIWTGDTMPGINQCARLLTAAGATTGYAVGPDGERVRRYHDSFDRFEE
jgi:hypothetical protein